MNAVEWFISIDTGGTFTDGLGTHVSGHQKRVKVLSSSRIRGQVTRAITAQTLSLNLACPLQTLWPGGFRFALLGHNNSYEILNVKDDQWTLAEPLA
ncbi:MAG: hypothetical protein KDC71_18585, partial [Acidobacteria bacterium]|nr:hypothetical protein [Acidobacteriota bacterium]